jgi:hypothetical protein
VRAVWSGAVDLLWRLAVHPVDDILDGGDIAVDGFVDQGASHHRGRARLAAPHAGAEGGLQDQARAHGDGKEIAKQKVVAGLLGVSLDEIVRRAEQARRRRLRSWVGAVSASSRLSTVRYLRQDCRQGRTRPTVSASSRLSTVSRLLSSCDCPSNSPLSRALAIFSRGFFAPRPSTAAR